MQPGDIKSFVGRRADRAGKTIHVVLVQHMGKGRWRAWAWDQETPEGKWYKGGCITVSEHMIDPATKRPRKDTRERYFEQGQQAWGAIDESKGERKQRRQAGLQNRYEQNQERGSDRLVRGETYYWPGEWSYKSGTYTGEQKNGKAKMKPGDPIFGARKRPVWILLDRLFQSDGRGGYRRVQY